MPEVLAVGPATAPVVGELENGAVAVVVMAKCPPVVVAVAVVMVSAQ